MKLFQLALLPLLAGLTSFAQAETSMTCDGSFVYSGGGADNMIRSEPSTLHFRISDDAKELTLEYIAYSVAPFSPEALLKLTDTDLGVKKYSGGGDGWLFKISLSQNQDEITTEILSYDSEDVFSEASRFGSFFGTCSTR